MGKKETREFCNRLSMKVNRPVEFNKEKKKSNYKFIFTKLKLRHKLLQIPI